MEVYRTGCHSGLLMVLGVIVGLAVWAHLYGRTYNGRAPYWATTRRGYLLWHALARLGWGYALFNTKHSPYG